ncbi:polyhomeotic-like protein 2 [Stomoxys calcitrans]|uniref:PHD-type domain-containing protein n=1 Tax=Stomoxys calcitrans TaxID=35570 RepID=A0A1I8Q609_STOCA|nr:polyhomeotic-like protein 2 [Stomoxys calcitrans]
MTKTMEDRRQEEPLVRTTGRIKKPKAVFDPSDNYLPRAQRISLASASNQNAIPDRRISHSSRISTCSTDSGSAASVSKDACVVCGKRESKRPAFASKNRLISCLDCENKIHKLCLKVDIDDFDQLRSKFKCDKCAPCAVCHKVANLENGETVFMCSKCGKSYHNQCLTQKAVKAGEELPRDWKCPKCTVEPIDDNDTENMPVKKIREIIGEIQPQPVTSTTKAIPAEPTSSNCTPSPEFNLKRAHSVDTVKNEAEQLAKGEEEDGHVEEKRHKVVNPVTTTADCSSSEPRKAVVESVQRKSPNNTSDDIPDVKNWTVDEVHDYFLKQFPNEAGVFKDQEIDGRSLLLLTRSDVVKKLPLKLGPSLRLYSVILKIQTQLNDPTLGWNCNL